MAEVDSPKHETLVNECVTFRSLSGQIRHDSRRSVPVRHDEAATFVTVMILS